MGRKANFAAVAACVRRFSSMVSVVFLYASANAVTLAPYLSGPHYDRTPWPGQADGVVAVLPQNGILICQSFGVLSQVINSKAI